MMSPCKTCIKLIIFHISQLNIVWPYLFVNEYKSKDKQQSKLLTNLNTVQDDCSRNIVAPQVRLTSE